MKHLIWLAAFLLILFSGDRLAGHFLQKQVEKSQFRYSRLYRGEGKADILLLGNSRGLTFYQPYIEEVTGKTTFNLSYNGLPMDVAKVLVFDYLDRYPAPQKMILDITICSRPNDELLAGFLTYSTKSERLDTLIHSKLPKVWWGGKTSELFRYNNEIFQRALFYRSRTDKDWLLDRVIAPALAADVANNSYNFEIHPYLIEQLAETVVVARAKGVQVELVIGPYFPDLQVKNLDSLKIAVEKITNLAVRDYSRALSDPTDFGDFNHPNKKGSMKYIDLLKKDSVLP
ncbi:MAG: hypothetical protein OHK0019_35340 [Saprospiraceae bacterium]